MIKTSIKVAQKQQNYSILLHLLTACGGAADIAFLIDGSGSIKSSDFSRAKTFVKSMIRSLLALGQATRVSLAEIFKLNNYKLKRIKSFFQNVMFYISHNYPNISQLLKGKQGRSSSVLDENHQPETLSSNVSATADVSHLLTNVQ